MKGIAVITGASRGIGVEVARQLRDAGYDVLATARNAKASVVGDALGVRHHPLDVTDPLSIEALGRFLEPTGCDVLINNAGVALDGFDEEVARRTLAANFFGARDTTRRLLPLLRDGARVVMVSSGAGALAGLQDPVRGQLAKRGVTDAELESLAQEFPQRVARGSHGELGWPASAYKVSKALLNAWTRWLAARLQSEERPVLVNAVCPGWVRTDMGGQAAPRSAGEGAASVVWAAELAPDGPRGGFFRDGRAIDW